MKPLFPIVIGLISALRSAPLAVLHINILDRHPNLQWIGRQIGHQIGHTHYGML